MTALASPLPSLLPRLSGTASGWKRNGHGQWLETKSHNPLHSDSEVPASFFRFCRVVCDLTDGVTLPGFVPGQCKYLQCKFLKQL